MWRSSKGKSRSLSAELPASLTRSRIVRGAGGQIELMSVIDVAAALDDDVGMRFEQADKLLAGRHRFAGQHPPLGLGEDLRDQWLIVAKLGLPEFARRTRQRQQCRRLLQIIQGVPGDPEQSAVVLNPFRATAGIFDHPSRFFAARQ